MISPPSRPSLLFLLLPLCMASWLVAEEPSELETRVARAARKYRLSVYQAHRDSRSAFDRRMAAGQTSLERWQKRGHQQQEAESLIQWFTQAVDGSLSPWNPGEAHSSTAQNELVPSDSLDPTHSVRIPSTVDAEPNASVESSAPRPLSTSIQASPTSPTHLPSTALPGPPETVGGVPNPEKPTHRNGAADPPERVARRRQPLFHVERPPVELPDTEIGSAADARDAAASEWDRLPIVKLRQQEVGLESSTPVFDPLGAAPITSVISTETREPPIDVSFLQAKVRSFNVSVANLEHRLSENRQRWNIETLERASARLIRLRQQRELMALYLEALSPQHRRRCEALVELSQMTAWLAQRTFETKIQLVETGSNDQMERLNRILIEIRNER